MKTKVASRSRSKGKRIRKREFFNKRSNRNSSIVMRRESSTSLETQIGAQIIKALNSEYNSKPSFKRRVGNAGLDSDNINSLICDGKLVLPFLHNQGLTTSDDESHSVASLTIKDSRLDVILRQKTNLSSDDNLNKSCVNIEEYHSSDDKMTVKSYKEDNDTDDDKCVTSNIYKNHKENDVEILKNNSKHNKNLKSTSLRKNKKKLHEKASRSHKITEGELMNEVDKCDNKKENYNSKPSKIAGSMSSFDSYCSELSPLAIHSSFSGVSVGKTNSRNSKLSCDVGIQANAHEIAIQTMSSFEKESSAIENVKEASDKKLKDGNLNNSHFKVVNNRRNSVDYESESECTHLLISSAKPVTLQKKKQDSISNIGQNETDRLKLLLLPTK